MAQPVLVYLSDQEAQILKEKSDAAGLTPAQYLKKAALGDDPIFQFYYNRFLELAGRMPSEQPFTVMKVFGEEWSAIPKGTRLSLGRTIYHSVKNGKISIIDTAGKNSSNLQLYTLTSERSAK